MMFKTVACDYTSKFDLPCNGVVSLQVFVVQFNIRIIDVLKKPKDLSIVISLGELIYFGELIDVFQDIALKSRLSVVKQTYRLYMDA